MSQEYVVGFLFRRNNTEVALIRKTKPDWQRGKLNGIGGKIEFGELATIALIREFKEEAGCMTARSDWRFFLSLAYPEATIHFFESRAGDGVVLQSMTDEAVGWWTVSDLLNEVTIPNLRWLIPLALDETGISGAIGVSRGL